MANIAVIGAGFSGSLLALHLLRQCPTSTRVHLIERNRRFGLGAAYSTGNPNHLLNVPAARMSAFHDAPRDFLEWACTETGAAVSEGSFMPRQVYGDYIRQLILSELRRPGHAGRLHLKRGKVVALDEAEDGLCLTLEGGQTVAADLAVLAIGNFPPELPGSASADFLDSRCYRADPWAADALSDLDPDASVLLVGTGLTMVDTMISLLDRGHRGRIHALSRRGLLPLRHRPDVARTPLRRRAFPTKLMTLMRLVRDEAGTALASGASWQPIVDELRPFTQDLWLSFSAEDRARFLRHLRPWWEIHRHRVAPDVANRLDAACMSGQLQVRAGRIRDLRLADGGAEVHFNARFSGEPVAIRIARVINCSGPSCDYGRIADPLVRDLLRRGMARPDPLRLGLDVTATCALKHADGAIGRRLFAVGPVTKGAFWEITAVPDIRRQAEFLAGHLRGLVSSLPAAPPPLEATMPAAL